MDEVKQKQRDEGRKEKRVKEKGGNKRTKRGSQK